MDRASSKIILLLISSGCLMVTTSRDSVEIIHAINSGGPRHTVNDIKYVADETPSNGTLAWRYKIRGIAGPEEVLYKTCRFSENDTGFTYWLPVDGDGWYGLALLTNVYTGQVNQYLYDVTLNGNVVIQHWYDPFKQCGLFNTCNEIVYFHICDGILYWKSGNSSISSRVVNNRVTLNFDKYGYVDAVVLAKGKKNRARTVIKNKAILFFDPAKDRKCNKGKGHHAKKDSEE
jgi:Malectin domain